MLEWDRSKSKRDNVRDAKPAGEVVVLEKLLKASGTADKPFSVELDIEITPLTIVEDGKSAKHTVPSKITAKVATNDFWKLSGECEGPHYQMPEDGKTAEAMLLNCVVKMRHGDQHDELVSLQLYGDSNINAIGSKVILEDHK